MSKKLKTIYPIIFLLIFLIPTTVSANANINVDINGENSLDTVGLLILMTIISFLPSIIMTMTSFTRFIVVFSFLRTSLGTQNIPPNQVLIGLSLVMTFFVFAPTFDEIKVNAYEPYVAEEIEQEEALDIASYHMKDFMLRYTNENDIVLFLDLANETNVYQEYTEAPIYVIAPAFIISELKTAFEIGFLLFIPFIVIDIVIASILMSMGMFMMPPTMIALPFKILLFVLVDGWHLIIESLIKGVV